MVLKVNKSTSKAELEKWLKKIQEKRKKNTQSGLSKFFGILPEIGDGMELQKKMRDEWD